MVSPEDLEAAAEMNIFLRRHALDQAKTGISRTFVLRDDQAEEPQRVVGYYSASAGHLQPRELPKVVSEQMTIPVVFLQRLAIDKDFQHRGLGTKLLVHFLVSLVRVADDIGVYALVLEPLNARVDAFYRQFGLFPLPEDPSHLYVRIRDVRAWLLAHGHGRLCDTGMRSP